MSCRKETAHLRQIEAHIGIFNKIVHVSTHSLNLCLTKFDKPQKQYHMKKTRNHRPTKQQKNATNIPIKKRQSPPSVNISTLKPICKLQQETYIQNYKTVQQLGDGGSPLIYSPLPSIREFSFFFTTANNPCDKHGYRTNSRF